jgi:hypothetical protein
MTKKFLPRTIIAALLGASVVALAPAGAQGVERRRWPRRVCRGEATVTGTSRFHVAYADGCVYPDEGNA